MFNYSNNSSNSEVDALAMLGGNNDWSLNATGSTYSMSDIIEYFTSLFDAIVSYCRDDFFTCESMVLFYSYRFL